MLWLERFKAASLGSLMLHDDTKLMREDLPIGFFNQQKTPADRV